VPHEGADFARRAYLVFRAQIARNRGRAELLHDLLEESDSVLSVTGVLAGLGKEIEETAVELIDEAAEMLGVELSDEVRTRWAAEQAGVETWVEDDYNGRVELILSTLLKAERSSIRSQWIGFTRFCEDRGMDARQIAESLEPGIAAELDAMEEPIADAVVEQTIDEFKTAAGACLPALVDTRRRLNGRLRRALG
jgi:hypothetical protein